MTVTDEQRAAWSCVPVDDVGYLPSEQLLALGDDELRAVVAQAERNRYQGWRNHEGRWLAHLRLDEATGRRVLDYGCGLGIEALQYARAGAVVSVADIVGANCWLADRVLRLHGHGAAERFFVGTEASGASCITGPFDVVHMSGVLHHVPDPVPVMRECAESWLAPGGEIRLMLYSDEGWRIATGSEPPQDVAGHPDRERFVRFFDAVGDWADWYDENRLAERFGRWYDVLDVTYITPDRRYLTAVLKLKASS